LGLGVKYDICHTWGKCWVREEGSGEKEVGRRKRVDLGNKKNRKILAVVVV